MSTTITLPAYRLVSAYERWWRSTGQSPATSKSYVYALRMLGIELAYAGQADVEVDPKAVEKALLRADRHNLSGYLADRLERVGPATVSMDARAIRSFYAWLTDEEHELEANPAKNLRGPKVPETEVPMVDEVTYKRLLAVAKRDASTIGRRDAALIAMLWHGGVRRGELPRCTIGGFDAAEAVLNIPTTKGGKPRNPRMHPEVVALVERYLRRRIDEPATAPLFAAERGGALSSNGIGQMMGRRCEEAGVQVSAHAFRRALSVRWLRAGGSESGLMAHNGWRSAAMVRRYTRMASEELAQAEYTALLG